jgi:hypothetical protein
MVNGTGTGTGSWSPFWMEGLKEDAWLRKMHGFRVRM